MRDKLLARSFLRHLDPLYILYSPVVVVVLVLKGLFELGLFSLCVNLVLLQQGLELCYLLPEYIVGRAALFTLRLGMGFVLAFLLLELFKLCLQGANLSFQVFASSLPVVALNLLIAHHLSVALEFVV